MPVSVVVRVALEFAYPMSVQQNILGLIDPRGQSGRAAVIWMKLLHQASVRGDDLLAARALRQAQDFVRLIAGQRTAAPAARPRVALTLLCLTPGGKPAGEISLERRPACGSVAEAIAQHVETFGAGHPPQGPPGERACRPRAAHPPGIAVEPHLDGR